MMKFFKKKPKDYNSVSLSALTWKRFRKQWEGMVSLGFILLVIVISILGYLITPNFKECPTARRIATTSSWKSPCASPVSRYSCCK